MQHIICGSAVAAIIPLLVQCHPHMCDAFTPVQRCPASVSLEVSKLALTVDAKVDHNGMGIGFLEVAEGPEHLCYGHVVGLLISAITAVIAIR